MDAAGESRECVTLRLDGARFVAYYFFVHRFLWAARFCPYRAARLPFLPPLRVCFSLARFYFGLRPCAQANSATASFALPNPARLKIRRIQIRYNEVHDVTVIYPKDYRCAGFCRVVWFMDDFQMENGASVLGKMICHTA